MVLLAPIVPALIAAGSQLATNIWSSYEAKKNREFQERMSSTAHQREVEDLRAAGLNPVLSAMRGAGASTPGGATPQLEDPGSKGVSTALQAKLLKAQIGLIEDQALLTRTNAAAIQQEWQAGKFERLMSEKELAALDVEQRRSMLPLVLQRAKEEIKLTSSSAAAARAGALLDEAALAGARNEEAFNKAVGEMGPWVRMFYNLLRSTRR